MIQTDDHELILDLEQQNKNQNQQIDGLKDEVRLLLERLNQSQKETEGLLKIQNQFSAIRVIYIGIIFLLFSTLLLTAFTLEKNEMAKETVQLMERCTLVLIGVLSSLSSSMGDSSNGSRNGT
jgi:thiosulfate reductase cytochrome b subunit